jgi:Ca-activated chloride channel homolog
MMKRVLLTAMFACTTMACASGQTVMPQPATSAATPDADQAQGAEGATDGATIAVDAPTTNASVANQTWLGAAGGSEFVMVGGHEQFVGVWVDVPASKRRAHVPTSVTLTIDTSGSMQGDKIVQARRAAIEMVKEMKDGDLIAIHTFNDRAHELIRPTELSPHSRASIVSTVSELSADGATNMDQALRLAVGRAQRTPNSHPVRRVVMISDGRATVGETSPHALALEAERGVHHGVQVTAMGVGLDYDENALNQIAMRSSGRLYHLSDPTELAGIVRSELGLLQQTMATNAFVEVVPAPGVQLVDARGVSSQWGNQGALRVPLGTMFEGQRREFLVRFRMTSGAVEGTQPIASARFHFNDPTDGGLQRVQEVVVRGQLTTDATLVSRHHNPEVQAIIAMNQASTVATAARGQVASGQFDEADAELGRAEEQLRQQAKRVKSKKDKSRMMKAAAGIAKNRRSVRSAQQAPPSARPAASRASALELNDSAMDMQGL